MNFINLNHQPSFARAATTPSRFSRYFASLAFSPSTTAAGALSTKEGLERTIEESFKLQPAIEDVEVKINLNDNTGFDYISLSGDMLDVRIHTVVDDVKAIIRIEYIEELNYPLMYVEDIIED